MIRMINNIYKLVLFLGIITLGTFGCLHQSKKPPSPQVLALYDTCLRCHSSREMQRGPSLAGLDREYIYRQLGNFKKGIRGKNPINRSEALMGSVPLDYEDDLLEELADYISSLPSRPKFLSIEGDGDHGESLYLDRCASCHDGTRAVNKDFGAPDLKKMEGWYIMLQLQHYKAGRRGYHPDDDSGKLMSAVLKDLSSTDFKDIVHYLERL